MASAFVYLAYLYGYYIIIGVWRLKWNLDERLINFFLKIAINDAGSAENIKVWCYPTPQQRLIFSEAKLILLGAWGTGKTLFMVAEAIRLAELGQKVLFLLFSSKEQNSGLKKVGFFNGFPWLKSRIKLRQNSLMWSLLAKLGNFRK